MPAPWPGVLAEGMVTVTDRPPSSRGWAVAVPPWIAAMDATMARPSPKPSWEVRSLSRWNGWKMRSTSAGLMTGPVLATVSWLLPATGAGADPDVTGRRVVPDRVVDQVRDEVFGQHRVTRYDGGFQRGVRSPVAQAGGIEDVFGDGGQVDLLVDGEPALVAREDEQRADEVLGVIHRSADVRRHGAQVVGRAVAGCPATTSTVVRMTASGVRSSCEALAMNRCWPSNAAWSRPSISSNVSASSRSSSRGPVSATRADRLCSDAARAAAVIW